MEPELVLPDKVYPIGGNRRDAGFAGKGITVGHLKAGRHLYKKVFYAIVFEGF
jgi:hypothetical protein